MSAYFIKYSLSSNRKMEQIFLYKSIRFSVWRSKKNVSGKIRKTNFIKVLVIGIWRTGMWKLSGLNISMQILLNSLVSLNTLSNYISCKSALSEGLSIK